MSSDEIRKDPTLQLLASLPAPDVDRARAERTRLRCHRALERRQKPPHRGAIEFGVVAVLCGAYLLDVLVRALSLIG